MMIILIIIYRNCTLYNIKTDAIKSFMLVVFGSDIGGYSNPFDIDLGLRSWQVWYFIEKTALIEAM